MDIVERLRNNCSCNIDSTPCGAEEQCRNAYEAADQIERLRAALQQVADFELHGDYSNAYRMPTIARAALKELRT